jgi:plasmid stabilization system protein ParE
LIITDRARRDLDAVYDRLVQVSDPETARSFLHKLNARLERIARLGHSGVPRDKVRPGLRLATHGRYNIYFRVTTTETIIRPGGA